MTTYMHAETKRLLMKIRQSIAYESEYSNNFTATSTQKSSRSTVDRKRITRRTQ
jgi:hypothetical protein